MSKMELAHINKNKIEFLRKTVYCLRFGKPLPEDDNYIDVLHAVYLASTKYERHLNKKQLSVLLSRLTGQPPNSKEFVELFELSEKVFEECTTDSVELFWDGTDSTEIRKRSKESRFLLPQISEIIDREARRVISKLRENLSVVPYTVEDIRNDLYVYLFDNLEKNFRPERSPYRSYIMMSINLRGRRLVSLYTKKHSHESLLSPPNSSESQTIEECLDYLALLKNSLVDAIGQFEVVDMLKKISQKLTNAEKGLLLLHLLETENVPMLPLSAHAELTSRLRQKLNDLLGE